MSQHEVTLPEELRDQLTAEAASGLLGQALVVEVEGHPATRGVIVAVDIREGGVVLTVEDGDRVDSLGTDQEVHDRNWHPARRGHEDAGQHRSQLRFHSSFPHAVQAWHDQSSEGERRMTEQNETTYLDSEDLVGTGYLQEVNRRFFHPLGLALEVELHSGAMRIQDHRDDPEGVRFDQVGADKVTWVDIEWDARSKDRYRLLGYVVQPVHKENIEP